MDLPTLRVAVIGVGYLGRFHAQKYARLETAKLIGVCDIEAKRCQEIAKELNTEAIANYRDLIGRVDAVSIVVPTVYHFEVAKFFLEQGVHVLLEKPITSTLKEADVLIQLANQQKLVLQVGHLERFNNAILAAEAEMSSEPQFIESHRLSIFNPRALDVNVVLDLMIHDIDLIQFLVKSKIKKIDAHGACFLTDKIDIAHARIHFENGCVANLNASRMSFYNERRMRIFQKDAYLNFDLQQKHLVIQKKSVNEIMPGVPEMLTLEKTLEKGDEIQAEIIAFLKSIKDKLPPVVSGLDARNALATALEISHQIETQFANALIP